MDLIYYKPHSKRKKEHEFFLDLYSKLDKPKHFNHYPVLEDHLFENLVSIKDLIEKVDNYNKISLSKKERVIKSLEKLPNEVRVAKRIEDVSVDVIVVSDTIRFFEFHEKQHRIDSNKRLVPVYDANGKVYYTPRFVQRLIKDAWRYYNIPNFKIVWYDWFEQNKDVDCISNGRIEYSLLNKFSFNDMLKNEIYG